MDFDDDTLAVDASQGRGDGLSKHDFPLLLMPRSGGSGEADSGEGADAQPSRAV